MNGESDDSSDRDFGISGNNRTFRLKVEASLSQRFVKAMELRVKQLQVTNATDFKLSEHEQKILMDVCTSNLLEGVAAGAITFFVLRRLHKAYEKYIFRLYNKQQPTSAPTVPNSFNSPYQQLPNKQLQQTALQETLKGSRNRIRTSDPFGSIRWMYNGAILIFDGIISFYVTVYISTRNPEKFLQKVSDLPLIEGNSVVARELCPALLEELQAIQNDLDQDNADAGQTTLPRISNNNKKFVQDAIVDPKLPTLKCLLDFCSNCRRRSAYQQILREQNGMFDVDVANISIPPPGVPPNLDISNDTSTISSDMHYDNNFNIDSNETQHNDDDWTEPFITDTDDSNNNRRK